MANNNIQFASNTLKYESDSYVKGSNGLYVFQFGTGTNRDLRQELVNYHAKKKGLTELVKDSNPNKNIGECFWGVFKKPDDQSYEDFIDDVKHSRVGFIGNSPIIPTGRNYTKVDLNGNLLVATVNSKLDDYIDGCGNMLISGETGEVIRAPRPSVIINPADKITGFYPIEVYKTRENMVTGNKEVYDREFNFLDPDGKILCDDYNFSSDGEQRIYEVPRNFYMREGKCVYNSWDLYPTAYVIADWNKTKLYPSIVDLLVESRSRVNDGDEPLVKNEYPYLQAYYKRKNQLDAITESLGQAFDAGAITESIYNKALKCLDAEYGKFEFFEKYVATVDDDKIEEQLLNGSEQAED